MITVAQCVWGRGAGVEAGEVAGAEPCRVGWVLVRNMDIIQVLWESIKIGR